MPERPGREGTGRGCSSGAARSTLAVAHTRRPDSPSPRPPAPPRRRPAPSGPSPAPLAEAPRAAGTSRLAPRRARSRPPAPGTRVSGKLGDLTASAAAGTSRPKFFVSRAPHGVASSRGRAGAASRSGGSAGGGTGGSENGCQRRPALPSPGDGVRARLPFAAASWKLPSPEPDPGAVRRRAGGVHRPEGDEVCRSCPGAPRPLLPICRVKGTPQEDPEAGAPGCAPFPAPSGAWRGGRRAAGGARGARGCGGSSCLHLLFRGRGSRVLPGRGAPPW